MRILKWIGVVALGAGLIYIMASVAVCRFFNIGIFPSLLIVPLVVALLVFLAVLGIIVLVGKVASAAGFSFQIEGAAKLQKVILVVVGYGCYFFAWYRNISVALALYQFPSLFVLVFSGLSLVLLSIAIGFLLSPWLPKEKAVIYGVAVIALLIAFATYYKSYGERQYFNPETGDAVVLVCPKDKQEFPASSGIKFCPIHGVKLVEVDKGEVDTLRTNKKRATDEMVSAVSSPFMELLRHIPWVGKFFQGPPQPPPPLMVDPVQIFINGGEAIPPLGKFKVTKVRGKVAIGKTGAPHEPGTLLKEGLVYYINEGTASEGMLVLVERGTESSVSLEWKEVKW